MGAGTQLAVSYEVNGENVQFDKEFVKQYLVRGDANKLSDQEAIFFMNLCKAQKLNPLNGSDCYCVKYGNAPAQMIVGKAAYMRRAYNNPNYLYKEDGIVVMRSNTVTKKEGCCVYPGEKLLGGWCKIHYTKNGVHCYAYKEVAFDEYNKGQSTWKAMPATMIVKVAISQCARDAFPDEYDGLYSEEEMVASGAIDGKFVDATDEKKPDVITLAVESKPEPKRESAISNDERKGLIALALDVYGDKQLAQETLKFLIEDEGFKDTYSLTREAYEKIKGMLNEEKRLKEQPKAEELEHIPDEQMEIERFKESEHGLPFV